MYPVGARFKVEEPAESGRLIRDITDAHYNGSGFINLILSTIAENSPESSPPATASTWLYSIFRITYVGQQSHELTPHSFEGMALIEEDSTVPLAIYPNPDNPQAPAFAQVIDRAAGVQSRP